LTRERLRLWSLAALAGTVLTIIWLAVSAHGLSDYRGRPLGTDFSDVYAAGVLAQEGRPAAAYDWAEHYRQQQEIFGKDTLFYGWHYPPFFLLIAEALALLPYIPALLVWQGLTLLLYLLALRALLHSTSPELARDPLWLLAALAFPAVFVNLMHGQNGFLTVAILAGGLALLQPRPFLSGLVFGLLLYKPQFAVALPFALAAGGKWKTLLGAALTAVILVLTATFIFGAGIWTAFFDSAQLSRTIVLEQGNTGFEKMQSVFAMARLLGSPVAFAYMLQGTTLLAVLTALVIVWRKPALHPLKGAALCLATTLSTPYCLDYDLMLLAPAIVLMTAEGRAKGFKNGEILLLSGLWLCPFVVRTLAGATHLVAAPVLMLTALLLVLRRAKLTF